MKLNLESLIGKSPQQLSYIKQRLLESFRFQDAALVQEYIDHCIVTGHLVNKILNK